MDTTVKKFLKALANDGFSNLERAIATLWWHERFSDNGSKTAKEVAYELEQAGYPKQNVSRLNSSLHGDRRTAKSSSAGYRIRVGRLTELDEIFLRFVSSQPIVASDSLVPRELVTSTRGYIEKVVKQINASFDACLYDCCGHVQTFTGNLCNRGL